MTQRFRLKTPTLAVRCTFEGAKSAVMMPAGAEIATDDLDALTSSEPDPTKFVNVEWDGARVGMFLLDLQERGERIWRSY